jgi:HK97 family phage major capsid protein
MSTALATITELGPNMSLEDMRKEAKGRLEQASALELKHTGPGTDPLAGADLEQVKQLLAEADALHAAIEAREDVQALTDKTHQLLDHYSKPLLPAQTALGGAKGRPVDPGQQFVRSGAYLEVKNRGLLNSALNKLDFSAPLADGTSLLEWKATLAGSVTTSGGALVPTDVRSTIVDTLFPQINVLDLIPRTTTESDAIEYIRQTTQTLAVAFVAEATGSARTGTDGVKPESTLAYQNVTAYVRTAAHWIPVTNRLLADAPAIRGIINTQMLMGLTNAVEAQVISGDGTGENLLGILQTPNVQTFARGALNEVDAIFHARTLVRTGSKLAPTGVVMNPVDYEQVRLLRENAASATLGQYLMAPPNTLGVPTVFGMPVVESENIAVNTVLVGNFSQGSQIFDREQSAIRVGLINDQLIRNQQTILAEQRLAFVVWRPPAFCSITAY